MNAAREGEVTIAPHDPIPEGPSGQDDALALMLESGAKWNSVLARRTEEGKAA